MFAPWNCAIIAIRDQQRTSPLVYSYDHYIYILRRRDIVHTVRDACYREFSRVLREIGERSSRSTLAYHHVYHYKRFENDSPRRLAQSDLQCAKDLGRSCIAVGGCEDVFDVF